MRYGLINIEHWKRKAHYELFSQYEDPNYGVTVDVDCTNAYSIAKSLATSFFLFYLHKSILAINEIDAFKLRICDEGVRIYDRVDASSIIHRPDGTFGFASIPYKKAYPAFAEMAQREIIQIQERTDLNPIEEKLHVIHYSTIPWLTFTSLSHARKDNQHQGIPKITFGKIKNLAGRMYLPMSIHVHHALIDTREIGQYIDRFQDLLNNIWDE